MDLSYVPQSGDQLTMVGYGRSDVDVPKAGEKLLTVDETAAFGRDTGILRMTGKGACTGDSGGPVFYGAEQTWVGAISRSAFVESTSGAAGSAGATNPSFAQECQGMTDAATGANDDVATFVQGVLDEAQRYAACLDARDNAATGSAGAAGSAGASLLDDCDDVLTGAAGAGGTPFAPDPGDEVGEPSTPGNGPTASSADDAPGGCTCRAAGQGNGSGRWSPVLLALMVYRRRRR